MIVGVVGTPGAGKDLLAKYLSLYGFTSISLSDMLREKIGNASDFDLSALGNRLRKQHGAAFLAELALKRAGQYQRVAITSVRSVAEATLLKDRGAILIAVDADPNVRFKRTIDRAKEEGRMPPGATLRGFLSLENSQQSAAPHEMNLGKVMEMAEVLLVNNYDAKEEFFKMVDRKLKGLIEKDALSLACES